MKITLKQLHHKLKKDQDDRDRLSGVSGSNDELDEDHPISADGLISFAKIYAKLPPSKQHKLDAILDGHSRGLPPEEIKGLYGILGSWHM